MCRVRFSVGVAVDLRALRAHDRVAIVDAIGKLLSHEPDVQTRDRKALLGLEPPFEAVPPIWELRIREIRVFYDIDAEEKIVFVRAVRRKPTHRSTLEIL